jgi:hypothetical protein
MTRKKIDGDLRVPVTFSLPEDLAKRARTASRLAEVTLSSPVLKALVPQVGKAERWAASEQKRN